jgi:DNA polymerase III delta prime subunit
MENLNPFSVILKKENLSHAYLCLGNFYENKDDFENSLNNLGVKINTPGNFIFIGNTFTRDDADQLNSWYTKGATADSPYTIAVISAGTLKTDAQQLLLKVFEEARHPYIFFLFAPYGTEILPTIKSRCSLVELANTNDNKEIQKFIKMSAGERIKHIAEQIKNKESSEVRTFTEELVRNLINHFHADGFGKNKDILNKLLQTQNSLTTGHIAPKFILDYVVTVI